MTWINLQGLCATLNAMMCQKGTEQSCRHVLNLYVRFGVACVASQTSLQLKRLSLFSFCLLYWETGGFNWKALIRVEKEIFFPWLQSLLPTSSTKLIGDIIEEHNVIGALSAQLGVLCLSSENSGVHDDRLQKIEILIGKLKNSALRIQTAQVCCHSYDVFIYIYIYITYIYVLSILL